MRLLVDLFLFIIGIEGLALIWKLRRLKQECDGYKQAAGGLAVRINMQSLELRGALKITACLLADLPEPTVRLPESRLAAIQLGTTHSVFVTVDPANNDRIVMLKEEGGVAI